MTLLFGLMLAGYAFGVAVAVLSPSGGPARRLVAMGAVVGAGAGWGLRKLSSGALAERPPGCPLEGKT